jgi:ferric-dicitrate binding protein FerR (iron transport regulator)
MKTNDRLHYLMDKYLKGEIDLIEQDELFELIESKKSDDAILAEIESDLRDDHQNSNVSLPPYIAEDIIRKILKSEPEVNHIIGGKQQSGFNFKRFAIAAVFIGIIALTYFAGSQLKNRQSDFATIIPENIEYKINNSKQVELLVLSDGTKVYLNPGSVLHFDHQFKGENREVYLEGEAFFQVKKNPNKPFLVYYNNIVTKVLGTSFRVATNKLNGQLVVEVKTGRVQVFENIKLGNTNSKITPVIITPNQKVSYDKDVRRFETAIVGHPEPVLPNEESLKMESKALYFEQQKLLHVFEQLEKYYLIDITVENESIYNCVFTGDLSNLDLFSALKIICITTNAEYEINGTKILIKGKGCNLKNN